ncbi:nucleoside-diphosphate sugar epimerase/dehydratase [Enterococcus faecium]|uniref:polysaccharide biosynthesis protein n=1 Tax=Enterococcus faecium TaxID=1352 RepID=UPI001E40B687|nr:nucleoside-diphosphate sugar epimerase/dehydratase [Enterococcus faecium]MCD4946204.1 polysaccharide biosynthesis protein [Enterococcus faecium]MDQ8318340.1 nucleoside-diphosphate sugar epimerase/dehydratase [Enterococcus faecium]MDQ8337382.1 nucleoside-diphosphate sugar epimerase/dehydratase [Enterococcus faecium]MDQ8437294.1 nucleoside-diphosphate sugar epimerase/dehydratase [Enterococcus faecium]MDQ8442292.1 nucleoside-diphosphate sugar epimerase/dehydratase [Enterococcus faecium]
MFILTRRRKIATLVFVDSLLLIAANIAAAKFMKPFVSIPMDLILISIGLSIGFYLFYGSLFKVFTRINRYTNLREIIAIFSSLSASAASSILILLFINRRYSLRLVIFAYLLSLLLIIGSRLIWRIYIETKNMRYVSADSAKNTLIVGAGEGGRILYNSFLGSKTAQDIHVVGFVDDDPNKRNTYLSGKKVLGALKDIPELIEKYDIQMVTIAIPSLSRKKLRRIFELVESAHVKVNTMPSIEELASGKISVSKLKTIDVVDLLGRDEVELDIESIKDQITDKVILVTGAGGSIGSEICRQIIQFNPAKLLLLGHGENSIYLIDRELRTHHQNCPTEIVPIIADIQDREKINEIMEQYHPDIVYHAAAHKHVPLMEYNPKEAVKNNIFGTKNVAEAAKAAKVKNFVMVSTDKANNPPNVMGSTKRIAEMIVTGLNEEGCTKFSAVRFGNVLGSRGSVIPVFREQIAQGGPITVTDFRMTRYFMTIPEASRLVIQSGALAKGGEIFILDMSEPVKIVDLAKNMIRLSGYSEDEIEIIETGIRPGEKLYEELLLDKERNDEAVYEKIFVGNIKGYSIQKVMDFVKSLPQDDEQLAKDIVTFANASNK